MAENAIYSIEVHTAAISGADTGAGIFMTMFGTLGTSLEFALHRDTEKRRMDGTKIVEQKIDYIGDIYAIELSCDLRGKKPDWFCDRITITNPDPAKPSQLSNVKSTFTDIGQFTTNDRAGADRRYIKVSSGLAPLQIIEEDLPSTYVYSNENDIYYYVPAGESYKFTVTNISTTNYKLTSTKTIKVSTSSEVGLKIDTKDVLGKLFGLTAEYSYKRSNENEDTTASTSTFTRKTTETMSVTLNNTSDKYTRRYVARYKLINKRQKIYAGQLVLQVDYDGGREFVDFVELEADKLAIQKAEEEEARKNYKYAENIGEYNVVPYDLREDIAAVMANYPNADDDNAANEYFHGYDSEDDWYRISSEEIRFPYRINYKPNDKVYSSLKNPRAKTIYKCIFTRHEDGHIREKYLRSILTLSNPPDWCLPFILRLSGEYVVEILEVIYKQFKKKTPKGLKKFCGENRALVKKNYDRMLTHRDRYYRDLGPLEDYVGKKLFDEFFLK